MGLPHPEPSTEAVTTIARLRHELEETRAALAQSTAEQQRWEQVALTAAGRERRRLAQTLHDTVSQSLTGLYLQAEVIAMDLQRNSANGVQTVLELAATIHATVVELSNVMRGLQSVDEAASGPHEVL